MLHVVSDILDALDPRDFAALTIFKLCAAFDTVDHKTLICRLEGSYGIRCAVSNTWQSSNLFYVCWDTVKPAKSVRDLGIFLDSDTSMKIQVFCSCATNTQHPSFRQSVSFTLSRHLVCAVALTLRRCKPHRNISPLAGLSCVSASRGSKIGVQRLKIRPYYTSCCVICTGCASQNVGLLRSL